MAEHASDLLVVDDTPVGLPSARTVKLADESHDTITLAEIPSIRAAAQAGMGALDAWYAGQPAARMNWWMSRAPAWKNIALARLSNLT